MTIQDEYSNNLPDKIIDFSRNDILEKLDPELKQQMLDAGGDIVFDPKTNTFKSVDVSSELGKKIDEDLKSKR